MFFFMPCQCLSSSSVFRCRLLLLLLLPLLVVLFNVPTAQPGDILKRDHAILAYTPYDSVTGGEEMDQGSTIFIGATTGFGVGAAIGSVIPGIGTIVGGIFGALLGAAGGKMIYEGKRDECYALCDVRVACVKLDGAPGPPCCGSGYERKCIVYFTEVLDMFSTTTSTTTTTTVSPAPVVPTAVLPGWQESTAPEEKEGEHTFHTCKRGRKTTQDYIMSENVCPF